MNSFYDLESLKSWYKVRSHKETKEGLIAIKKKLNNYGFSFIWLYFRRNVAGKYEQTGSTLRFEK